MDDPGRPLRILYVDDEPTNLRLIQAVVQMVLTCSYSHGIFTGATPSNRGPLCPLQPEVH